MQQNTHYVASLSFIVPSTYHIIPVIRHTKKAANQFYDLLPL